MEAPHVPVYRACGDRRWIMSNHNSRNNNNQNSQNKNNQSSQNKNNQSSQNKNDYNCK